MQFMGFSIINLPKQLVWSCHLAGAAGRSGPEPCAAGGPRGGRALLGAGAERLDGVRVGAEGTIHK